MNWLNLQNALKFVGSLGPQRIAALAIAVVMVAGVLGGASYLTSKTGYETLYVGLTQQDVSRMGSILSGSGIAFETSLDGTKLGVPFGRGAEARALLAQMGLPGSPNSGYELFDNMGALGLTSFMQEVTKSRALEGELARTIQYIHGVRAARIHLVLPESGPLRNKRRPPSASVVISADGNMEPSAISAIRHVVAAAILGNVGGSGEHCRLRWKVAGRWEQLGK